MVLPYSICLQLADSCGPWLKQLETTQFDQSLALFFFYLHMLSESVLEQSAFDKLLCSGVRLSSALRVDRL